MFFKQIVSFRTARFHQIEELYFKDEIEFKPQNLGLNPTIAVM